VEPLTHPIKTCFECGAAKGWQAFLWMSMKILLIITALMIFMETLKRYRLIDRVVRIIEPILNLLGLDRQVDVLWMTAVVFGITYGGAVIVAETRKRRLSPDQLKTLHVSIGINHAMVEDPSLFLPLGVHPFWLWIPRLVAAVAFTQAYWLWLWLWLWMKNSRQPIAGVTVPLDSS